MKPEYLIILLILVVSSCKPKEEDSQAKKETTSVENKTENNSEYKSAQFIFNNSVPIVPEYINTNINCINKGPISEPEKLAAQITISYFSEYSSIYFFTIITSKQIYFETFNDTGTPKPNLIFYVDDIEEKEYERIFKYFKENKTFKDLKYTHDSGQNIMISDKMKNDFGEMWEGDKFPLTILESTWLVKRHLEVYNQIGKSDMKFKQELLKPVFYNLCNIEKGFKHWKEMYPEIQNHELKY